MPETRGLGTSDSFELSPLHYSVEFGCSPPASGEHSRIRESEPKVANRGKAIVLGLVPDQVSCKTIKS